MDHLDRQSPLVRALVHFYGTRRVFDVLRYCEPEQVAQRLGRAAEFEVEWQKVKPAAPPPRAKWKGWT